MADKRIGEISRTTKETDISVKLNLDGSGKADITTGIGFMDHMLDAFTRHGLFDMDCTAKGDLNVDGHHTAEDLGIVLGEAIAKAVGNKMWQTRIFNPALRFFSKFEKFSFIHKAFGSIAYDMSLSNHFDGKYRVVSYEESIRRIAKAHMVV